MLYEVITPKDLVASAERVRQLERLRTMNLITEGEMKAEQQALEAALRGPAPAATPKAAAPAPVSNGPQMLV